MASPTETTATTVFVVRFWHEWSGEESRWRGRIEHAGSGQRASFLAMDEMLDFLRQMGVTIAAHRPTQQISENEIKEQKGG